MFTVRFLAYESWGQEVESLRARQSRLEINRSRDLPPCLAAVVKSGRLAAEAVARDTVQALDLMGV